MKTRTATIRRVNTRQLNLSRDYTETRRRPLLSAPLHASDQRVRLKEKKRPVKDLGLYWELVLKRLTPLRHAIIITHVGDSGGRNRHGASMKKVAAAARGWLLLRSPFRFSHGADGFRVHRRLSKRVASKRCSRNRSREIPTAGSWILNQFRVRKYTVARIYTRAIRLRAHEVTTETGREGRIG